MLRFSQEWVPRFLPENHSRYSSGQEEIRQRQGGQPAERLHVQSSGAFFAQRTPPASSGAARSLDSDGGWSTQVAAWTG